MNMHENDWLYHFNSPIYLGTNAGGMSILHFAAVAKEPPITHEAGNCRSAGREAAVDLHIAMTLAWPTDSGKSVGAVGWVGGKQNEADQVWEGSKLGSSSGCLIQTPSWTQSWNPDPCKFG